VSGSPNISEGESHEQEGVGGTFLDYVYRELCPGLLSATGAEVEQHLLPPHDEGRERPRQADSRGEFA